MNNPAYTLLEPTFFEDAKTTLEKQAEAEKNNKTYFPIFLQLHTETVDGWVVHVSSIRLEGSTENDDDATLGVEYEVIYTPQKMTVDVIETHRPQIQDVVSKAVVDILEKTMDNFK